MTCLLRSTLSRKDIVVLVVEDVRDDDDERTSLTIDHDLRAR